MILRRLIHLIVITGLCLPLAGCNLPSLAEPLFPQGEAKPGADLSIATPLPPLPETLVSFRVEVPANTPAGETIYLSILDEVTGLALNADLHPMVIAQGSSVEEQAPRIYVITLPFKIGAVIKYRYERQGESLQVAEHLSDGSPVRYRLYHVLGQGTAEDVVSSWTDTLFEAPTGRINGQAVDLDSGEPIPNLLVSAGGAQTITTSDGDFLLEGLPPGVHNLVAYALDGSYKVFQQGARVAAESTTPAQLALERADFIKAVFVAKVPGDTPPVVPLRLAGNLYQLGNTFASLTGGMSGLAANMPTLRALPDGRYTVSVDLPVGTDIHYKYTLGDGFWNAEHDTEGGFILRQVVIPDHNVLIEDEVETWHTGDQKSLTFDVYVPAETPTEDTISIQFDPLFGWTEPIPMWRLGGDRWAYVLHSPLNLPGNFNYRYCRNGQCGRADDIQTQGLYGQGRPVIIDSEPQILQDGVNAWIHWPPGEGEWTLPSANTTPRGPDFWAGVEFVPDFHPSWKSLLPITLDKLGAMGANWLVLTPTWSFGRSAPGNAPPVLALVSGQDALWFDLVEAIQQAGERDLKVALNPTPRFHTGVDEWWASAPRDFSWWLVWFEQYRAFALHHADMAAQNGVSALILGGDWLGPALPDGTLADGSPSGVPSDAENRWRDLLLEVREHYPGTLAWALPSQAVQDEPSFLEAVDQVYLLLSFKPEESIEEALGSDVESWLDYNVWTLQILADKPLVLGVEYSSDPDLQVQIDAYDNLLNAASGRDWISGFVTRGYYPPAALQDSSPSVHGKPAEALLGEWYPLLLGELGEEAP